MVNNVEYLSASSVCHRHEHLLKRIKKLLSSVCCFCRGIIFDDPYFSRCKEGLGGAAPWRFDFPKTSIRIQYLSSKLRFSDRAKICFKNIKFPRGNYQPIVPRLCCRNKPQFHLLVSLRARDMIKTLAKIKIIVQIIKRTGNKKGSTLTTTKFVYLGSQITSCYLY